MEKGKKKKIREMDSLYSLPKTPEGKKERRKAGRKEGRKEGKNKFSTTLGGRRDSSAALREEGASWDYSNTRTKQ